MIQRGWFNQPSTLQPFHHLHGQRVVFEREPGGNARVHFAAGPLVSMSVPMRALSVTNDFPTPVIAGPEAYKSSPEYIRMKANQEWDMAGLARQDGDITDEATHTTKAREWEERLR